MATTALRGTPVSTSGELPDVGDHAPEFTLTSTSLADVSSEGLVGSRVVLNIFPSVDTGVCAQSVRTFNEKAAGLDHRGRRYEMWNTDPQTYSPGDDPLYMSVPFLLALHEGRACGGQDAEVDRNRGVVADLDPGVGDVRVDRDGVVAGQGPGGGGPDQHRLTGRLAVISEEREAHVDRRVDDVLVAERDLMRGERGAATRAVRGDAMALVELVVLEESLQRPPDRLDVVVVKRYVGVVEVDPEADPLGQAVPLLHVGENRFAAERVELGDAVLLDLLGRGDAELLLDLELHRQSVTVPAGLPRHPEALHGPVARVDVLEDAGEHVVRAGASVCGRRALVEAPDIGVGALLQRALEDVVFLPALGDALFHVWKRLFGVDGKKSGHEQGIVWSGALG